MKRTIFGRTATTATFRWVAVLMLAVISLIIYSVIARESGRFAYNAPAGDRPIVTIVALFALAFAIYLAAVSIVAQASPSRFMLATVVCAAVGFRLVTVTSSPILEIDIYRYIWDGAVSCSGVNPYRFTPEQVLHSADEGDIDADLNRLKAIKDQDRNLETILKRVHFGFLPSIYPPTSQVVFALTTALLPTDPSVTQRMLAFKNVIVGFDLATLWLVALLLRLAGRPPELCLLYGWCPLLIKEFANSGHLDSIAIFLSTLSVYIIARATHRTEDKQDRISPKDFGWITSGMIVLALAVGAKLYPVVLFPVILARIARHFGSWRLNGLSSACFVFTSALVLGPMFHRDATHTSLLVNHSTGSDRMTTPVAPTDGLEVFLREWEMNDFLFLLLIENLKPDDQLTTHARAWFVITPDPIRSRFVRWASRTLARPAAEVPFAVARIVTLSVFAAILSWLVFRARRHPTLQDWLASIFLTLAWFWLLCPTQNPWYWAWAIPFLPFAGARSWILVSGLLFAYYLRFWFDQTWIDSTVWITPYRGSGFFDFIVTWFEFGPWFALLAVEAWFNGRCESQSAAIS